MALWFFTGTAAELIKIYPLIIHAERNKLPWYLVSSGQSATNLWKQYEDFQLPKEKCITLIETKGDLSNSSQALKWFSRSACLSAKFVRARLKEKLHTDISENDYWVVHGDTLTTLAGALLGRRLKLKIVHVEAGMRSHNVLSPFPEEINRRIVSRLALYHMVPDANAAQNLKTEGINSNITITNGNTVLDALNETLRSVKAPELPQKPYTVANFHRFENLASSLRWKIQIETLIKNAKKMKTIFVLQPNARHKLNADPETQKRLSEAGVEVIDRLPFSKFMHIMHNAEYVITDGGSNQQECYYLGKPCLLLRDKTESIEGMGSTCVLSEFKTEKIDEFLRDPMQYKRDPIKPERRPTDIIFEALKL